MMFRLIGCLFFAGALCGVRVDSLVAQEPIAIDAANIHARGDFENARIRFEDDRIGHVAFIGGSITEMDGYRPMVIRQLQERFPDTRFTFTDAGVSSTCSTTGAFRLQEDVLSQGPVDLLFVEFAVNDDQDAGHSLRDAVRGMEGIVRHTRLHNPASDIVVTYFVNPSMLETTRQGGTPVSVAAHERVAEHYQVPSIMLTQQVADSIDAGKLTWDVYGGTHPAPAGNQIAANMIDRLMRLTWDASASDSGGEMTPHPLPAPLDANSYFGGKWLSVDSATDLHNATVKVPDWSSIEGDNRSRFNKVELLCLQGSDASCAVSFEGTAIGIYVLAGPDAAKVEVIIDDEPANTVDLYHHYSAGLHYPRTVMLGTDLAEGAHRLRLRILPSSDDANRDTARILEFGVNAG